MFSVFCRSLLRNCSLLVAGSLVATAAAGDTNRLTIGASSTPTAVFNYFVGRLAVDPLRPRVYATVPGDNAVIVIDTNSLSVIKTIPIGPSPRGLTVSVDGKKLWVANSGSTSAAVGVVDLETLTTLPSLPAPTAPSDVEEGNGHRLFLTPARPSFGPNGQGTIMQIDARTGAFQTYFGGFEVFGGAFLELSPDRRTLFLGNTGLSPSSMYTYDVSTPIPSTSQQGNNFGSRGYGLRVSHDGRLVVFPNGSGNGNGDYRTFAIPTDNIRGVNGVFEVGRYLTAATFSNDDTLLYHGNGSESAVKIFDTRTFALVDTVSLGQSPGSSGSYDTRDLVVDRSGRWLFVAAESSFDAGDLRIFSTGRGDSLPPPQLANISTRLRVGLGEDALIGGFIITGNTPKEVLIRAIGPSLGQAGVAGALADPVIELHDSSGATIAINDNWQTTQRGGIITGDQVAAIQNSGIAPTHPAESAIVATLTPGGYTAIVRGVQDRTGVALVEAYDLNRTVPSRLANISTRGFVGAGDNVMIGGTIVTGGAAARVIVRAIAPSLAGQGVSNALADPTLELRDRNGVLVAFNDNWRESQAAEIQASGVPPTNDLECAIVATLVPGDHTAIVRGKNNATGVALVEAYQLAN